MSSQIETTGKQLSQSEDVHPGSAPPHIIHSTVDRAARYRTATIQHCDSLSSRLHFAPPPLHLLLPLSPGCRFPPELHTGFLRIVRTSKHRVLSSPDVSASLRTGCVLLSHPRQHRRTFACVCAFFWGALAKKLHRVIRETSSSSSSSGTFTLYLAAFEFRLTKVYRCFLHVYTNV